MIELFTIVVAVIAAIITAALTSVLTKYFDKPETPAYEYMSFRYSYHVMDKDMCFRQLNELGSQGWEIATTAGEDSFYGYLILKRQIPHSSETHDN